MNFSLFSFLFKASFKYHLLAVCVFSALFSFYIIWTWTDVIGGFGGDNTWYLLTAKFFSPFSEHSMATEYFARLSPYPPLVPLILAFSGAAESFQIAHLVTTLFLLFSFVLIYFWMIKMDFNPLISLSLVVAFSIVPMTYNHALEILSEYYFLFFCLLSIFLIEIHEKTTSHNKFLYIASLVIGLSILVRSTGIALMAGFALYSLLKCQKQQLIRIFPILFLPLLVSAFFSFKVEWKLSYFEMMSREFSSITTLGQAIQHMLNHIMNFVTGWFQIFEVTHISAAVFFGAMGIICLAGMVYRIIQYKFDGFFAFAYLSLLLAWPFSQEASRYLLPILPILLVQGIALISGLRWLAAPLISTIFILGLILHSLPSVSWTYSRYHEDIPAELESYKHAAIWYSNKQEPPMQSIILVDLLTNMMAEIKNQVSNDECVFFVKPSLMGLLADRISIPTPLEKLNDDEFFGEVYDKGCRYFFAVPFKTITYSTALYPLARIRDESTGVMAGQIDDAILAILFQLNDI